ncbi:MAG: FadR family transcriptional regulator [Burkholderiaceae bacterium]|nr:MAG: FadR family transcriptional regulator [Burkholderiaceae bacterium]
MPLQPLLPRRLYRQIAEQLRALIEHGEFPAGTRLPPERDLAVQLGVSRPSVREALIALEVEGRVEVRMGSGIYVRAAPVRAAAVEHEAESPLETIRARALIEGELAAVAARQMKRAQISGLREAIALMVQESAAGQMPTQGDRLFHTRIAEASENSVLLRVVSGLFDERHNPLFAQLGSHFETARSWAAAIEEHKAVVDAIAHQDPAAAREAMVRHLANSHERFMASWQAEGETPAKPPARKKRVTT